MCIRDRNKTCEVAYPIYRYTAMMLLQAEARAHQGKWGEALDLVKTVRDRAGLNTLTEKDVYKRQLCDSILVIHGFDVFLRSIQVMLLLNISRN